MADRKQWEALQRRSRKQEKRRAKEIGGSRQPASGATWRRKGDVKGSRFLMDNKATSSKSYRLSLEDILKVRKEALFEDRDWCLQVDFHLPDGSVVSCAVVDYNIVRELEEEE